MISSLARTCAMGADDLKIITTDPNPDVRKQIVRELSFNKNCASDQICKYYGAFMDKSSSTISIAMEFCEGGSLDGVYKEVKKLGGRTGEKVLGKVAEGVLNGLTYLHSQKIIHRGKSQILYAIPCSPSLIHSYFLTLSPQTSNPPTSSSVATAKSSSATSASPANSAPKAMPTPSSAHPITWHPNASQASPTPSPQTSGRWA